MTLADDILRIPTSRGDRDNAYLVDGHTLVDVGWKKSPAAIRSFMDEVGRSVTDINKIIITHAHPDHVRGLAEVVSMTGATVYIHRLDAGWLSGGRVPVGGRAGQAGRLLDAMPLMHWAPIDADVLLDGGEVIDGLRVIHTPGHSPGHIVLHHESSGSVLVGDALFHRTDELAIGPDALSADPRQRDESTALLPRGISAVGFAHGSPLTGSAVDAYECFLDRAKVSG